MTNHRTGGDELGFEVERLYSNEEISRVLGVGNAGGVRVHAARWARDLDAGE